MKREKKCVKRHSSCLFAFFAIYYKWYTQCGRNINNLINVKALVVVTKIFTTGGKLCFLIFNCSIRHNV